MSLLFTETREPVSLRWLLPHSSFVGCADIRVAGATDNSRHCGPDVLFAAISGRRHNGNDFVDEAVLRGASSVLVERPLPNVSVSQCVISNTRKAYAELCAALASHPSGCLKIAGVTGTNGKTTVTWLIRSILQAAGQQVGRLGTIEYHDGLEAQESQLTTPDPKTMCRWLSRMTKCGTTHAAIELSSHALDQDRIAGTSLDVAVVTNVTQDHFDYHHDFESYIAAKSRIIEHLKKDALVVLNADDAGSASLLGQASISHNVLTYGLQVAATVSAQVLEESLAGSRFVLRVGNDSIEVSTRLVGRHNVSNCLAAAATATHYGISLDEIASGIESLHSVPGRLERIDCGQPFDVFVDYAHTDDALRRSVQFLRKATSGRIICVFGAGGDRDRSKRPLLGQAASEADFAVITSDNPRTENPQDIINDILGGFVSARREPVVEVDREEAIRWSLANANPGDCVLVAGKGHETQQLVGEQRIPFDDRQVIRRVLVGSGPAIGEEQVRKCA